jgi:hypothetical protein
MSLAPFEAQHIPHIAEHCRGCQASELAAAILATCECFIERQQIVRAVLNVEVLFVERHELLPPAALDRVPAARIFDERTSHRRGRHRQKAQLLA